MASNRAKNKAKKAVKNFAKKNPVLAVVLAVIFIVVAIGGYFIYKELIKKPVVGAISFHFMTLGNKYSGDSIYIKAGDNDILIDAGSREGSVTAISEYLNDYVTDNTLEYVIVTHADRDHIAGFAKTNGGIFDLYDCQTIIDFPKTNKTSDTYYDYVAERDAEVAKGAKHFTALECWGESKEGAQKVYQLADSVTMEILYNDYYVESSTDENNYSVCVQFTHGDRKFLFTGDLEKEGEQKLVAKNNLGQVELYKAGHHASKTSSTNALLNVIKPKVCVVTCSAGYNEYDALHENVFPTQAFIDRISVWTDKVYVTTLGDPNFTGNESYVEMNGNVMVYSDEESVKVECSNNNTLLKDTAWFIQNRTCPSSWAN